MARSRPALGPGPSAWWLSDRCGRQKAPDIRYTLRAEVGVESICPLCFPLLSLTWSFLISAVFSLGVLTGGLWHSRGVGVMLSGQYRFGVKGTPICGGCSRRCGGVWRGGPAPFIYSCVCVRDLFRYPAGLGPARLLEELMTYGSDPMVPKKNENFGMFQYI